MSDQLALGRLLEEAAELADEHRRTVIDTHRSAVQAWFDGLARRDKERLAVWFDRFAFETCSALAAAAGSYGVDRNSPVVGNQET